MAHFTDIVAAAVTASWDRRQEWLERQSEARLSRKSRPTVTVQSRTVVGVNEGGAGGTGVLYNAPAAISRQYGNAGAEQNRNEMEQED